MKRDKKGIYMIIPRKIHEKLKKVALDKKTTMTELFTKWVERL